MSEFKGTPGPWWTDGEYINDECGIAIIAANTHCGPLPGNPTRGMVAWASEIVEKNAQRCQADARLIAAAPCLLEALEDALIHDGMGWELPIERMQAAIAKALQS